MDQKTVVIALAPALVVLSFFAHWITLVKIETAEHRLPLCRGAYLAFSVQLSLYGWIVFTAFGTGGAASVLLPLGMSFSTLGDIFNLQFGPICRRLGQPILYGILSFMAAQLCYIGAFVTMVPFSALASDGHLYPLLAALIVAPAILFKFRVYNPLRPKNIMRGAFVYGFILGAMAAVALSAAFLKGGYWYAVAAGAIFFLLSDAIMGETTIHGRHPRYEYQLPWIAYLAAQGLILFGAATMMVQV